MAAESKVWSKARKMAFARVALQRSHLSVTRTDRLLFTGYIVLKKSIPPTAINKVNKKFQSHL